MWGEILPNWMLVKIKMEYVLRHSIITDEFGKRDFFKMCVDDGNGKICFPLMPPIVVNSWNLATHDIFNQTQKYSAQNLIGLFEKGLGVWAMYKEKQRRKLKVKK